LGKITRPLTRHGSPEAIGTDGSGIIILLSHEEETMYRFFPSLAVGLVAMLPATAAEPLSIGDPAPPLAVKAFLKGDSFKSFEKDRIYVVEFSGTQCAPCVKAMPILTELQTKYPKVTFLSIYSENKLDVLKSYVEKHGSKMGYAVAADDSKMFKTWCSAAYVSGIPNVFVVDGRSRIAWIGSPFDVAGQLTKVVEGTNDLAADRFRLLWKQLEDREGMEYARSFERMNTCYSAVYKSLGEKKYREAIDRIDAEIAANPYREWDALSFKLYALAVDPGKSKEAVEFSRTLLMRIRSDCLKQNSSIAHVDTQIKSAINLLFAFDENPHRDFLTCAELFLDRAESSFAGMPTGTSYERSLKENALRDSIYGRVELAERRGEFARAVEWQTKYVAILEKREFATHGGGTTEVVFNDRKTAMLREARTKLSSLDEKAKVAKPK
jgi:thiol-disulfide isomerase/thioredoxin